MKKKTTKEVTPLQIQFVNGTALNFIPFKTKDSNLRKIRTHAKGQMGEGVWAFFSDEDLKKYDDDTCNSKEYEAVVILANSLLAFYPNNSWGMYVPVKFRGTERPECDLDDVSFNNPLFCKERQQAEKKAKKNAKAAA